MSRSHPVESDRLGEYGKPSGLGSANEGLGEALRDTRRATYLLQPDYSKVSHASSGCMLWPMSHGHSPFSELVRICMSLVFRPLVESWCVGMLLAVVNHRCYFGRWDQSTAGEARPVAQSSYRCRRWPCRPEDTATKSNRPQNASWERRLKHVYCVSLCVSVTVRNGRISAILNCL